MFSQCHVVAQVHCFGQRRCEQALTELVKYLSGSSGKIAFRFKWKGTWQVQRLFSQCQVVAQVYCFGQRWLEQALTELLKKMSG